MTSRPLEILFLTCIAISTLPSDLAGQSVSLSDRDAIVWSPHQIVTGSVAYASPGGDLWVDESSYAFTLDQDNHFEVEIPLGDGLHEIVACADPIGDGPTVCSDTLRLELGYRLHPEIFAEAVIDPAGIRLVAHLLDNPAGSTVSYRWLPDPDNPSVALIGSSTDSTTSVSFASGPIPGEYYFDVEATDSTGAVGRARTFLTVSNNGIRRFDIWEDHAAWIDSAVIYEVTPYNFVANGRLADVTARLPEIKDLGANTVWIQPVFETGYGGQGYDITNYFRFRPDYGSEADLRELVTNAHELGMRVLLDFVPNHTSILHPYAQDAIVHGHNSHYFDFYQRELDDVLYSRHYHQRTDGEMVFTYYFWDDLININYHSREVRRWITEAGLRWVEDFDIDGYRIDAVWGVNARTPEAMQQWRFDLKRAKPEVLLLGEDKATRPESFDRRFDAAYDWYPEEDWVSHWTWQYDYSESQNLTLFNLRNESGRVNLLRQSITNRGNGFAPDAKVLRFMENNDTYRFHATHGPAATERTKLAAAILFTLPGIPLVYNGQEIGYPRHPYSTFRVFERDQPIVDQDPYGLYPYYQQLAALRTRFAALHSDNYEEVEVGPGTVENLVFAYHRWKDGTESDDRGDIFVAANLTAKEVTAALTVPPETELNPDATYYITDLMTGEYQSAKGSTLVRIVRRLPAYAVRILALADAPISVGTSDDAPSEAPSPIPSVAHNFPNPFAESTQIPLSLPKATHVKLEVFDALGRRIVVLLDDFLPVGHHLITFDPTGLPSGTYFYRFTAADQRTVLPMQLAK